MSVIRPRPPAPRTLADLTSGAAAASLGSRGGPDTPRLPGSAAGAPRRHRSSRHSGLRPRLVDARAGRRTRLANVDGGDAERERLPAHAREPRALHAPG